MNLFKQKQGAVLFALITLRALAALVQFLSLPSEGFSWQRVLMSGALLALLAICAAASVFAWRESNWTARLFSLIEKKQDTVFFLSLFIFCARSALALLVMLLQAGEAFPYGAYTDRLAPLLDLISFAALTIVIVYIISFYLRWRGNKKTFLVKLLVTLGALTFFSLLIYFTGWGVTPGYQGDWSRGIPAVALLEWQIALACVLCLGMALLDLKKNGTKRFDIWVSVAVWIFAAALWLSQPVAPSPSALAPREPNFEFYPFNDAQIYDGYAQSAMIGSGYGENVIPQRPLYIVLLIAMRALAGQNYESVVVLQSLLFAFFPVLLYLFGKEFFGRPIGIAIAWLAILRDYTSNIAAPFTGNLSYSKLFLSEIPTAMALILFSLIGIRWVKKGFPLFDGFLMGGILGVGILIRTQVIAALPVLILFALLTRPKLILPALKSSALGIFVILVMVAPWLIRNGQMTGQLIFDHPASQTANLALRYSRVNGRAADISQHPEETNAAYNERMMQIAKEALAENPSAIGREIFSAFLNHGINNILLFPLRYDLESLSELGAPTRAFWQQWHGALNRLQALLLIFYIFLFGLGVSVAWQRLGWLGLLPLGVNLAYNLWTSIALLSGQRFMLTMDWSAYAYYMIGLFALISTLLHIHANSREWIRAWYAQNQPAFIEADDSASWRRYVFTGALFFAIGASLWGAEKIFPQRYPPASLESLTSKITSSSSFYLDEACFQKTIAEHELRLAQGRALYPRYYAAGEGENFTDAQGYKKSAESRIVFEMAGQNNGRVVFPISEFGGFFPNAADVTLGINSANKVWFIFVEHEGDSRFYLSKYFEGCR